MKTLLSVLVVMAMVVSPLCADTIFQEDFNGTGPGVPVAGYNGWTGDSRVVFSLDELETGTGLSTTWSGAAGWPGISKGFSHTPGAGETYTLTATLMTAGAAGDYSDLRIGNAASGNTLGVSLESGYIFFSYLADPKIGVVYNQYARKTINAKLVMDGTSTAAYWRDAGTTPWNYVGLMQGLPLSSLDKMLIYGHGGGYGGGLDTVLLTSTVIPEPTTLALLATGLIGLLAYAWRKRK